MCTVSCGQCTLLKYVNLLAECGHPSSRKVDKTLVQKISLFKVGGAAAGATTWSLFGQFNVPEMLWSMFSLSPLLSEPSLAS